LQIGHGWAFDLHVRIAPRRERRLVAKVFVARVQAPDEAAYAVHDHHLAVVAEVELEAISPAARGEAVDLDAAVAQGVHIRVGQCVASYAVVEQAHLHACRGALQQRIAQASPQGVVVDDEKLHEHVTLGSRDGGEHRFERGRAVYVEEEGVPRMHGCLQHPADCVETRVGEGHGSRQQAEATMPDGFLVQHEETRLPLPVQVDVAPEMAGAKEQVGHQRHVGQQHEAQHPREGTLSRAGVHDGVHGGEYAGHVKA